MSELNRRYNYGDSIYFELRDSSNNLVSVSFEAGDVKISEHGDSFVNVNSLPTQIGSSGVYRWNYIAGEVDVYGTIILRVVDQTPSKAWVDKTMMIFTKGVNIETINYSSVAAEELQKYLALFVDCYMYNTPTPTKSQFKISSGSSYNDVYNGRQLVFLGGENLGAMRKIKDWEGTNKIVTLENDLPFTPAGNEYVMILPLLEDELDRDNVALPSIPSVNTGSLRKIIQLIGAIAKNKKTETATLQTVRTEGDAGNLGTKSVSDNGTTLTVGELS